MQPVHTVGQAAAETGWSARMLRYLEQHGLVAPRRTAAGYRLYGLAELNRLRTLKRAPPPLRRRARRARVRPPAAARARAPQRAVDAWLAAGDDAGSWVEWEQRKHERLLAA